MSLKTKAMLEHELNEIYHLLLEGFSPQEIKTSRNISDRNYTKYMQKLRDNIISNQLAKRQEYFLLDIDITRESRLADKRHLQAIIINRFTCLMGHKDPNRQISSHLFGIHT